MDRQDNLFQGAKHKVRVNPDGKIETFSELNTATFIAEIKYDGIYCTCWWDSEGKVHLFSKTGKEKTNAQLQSLISYLEGWGLKDTALLGELAFGSQRGTQYYKAHGVHKIDFFDIIYSGGEYLGDYVLVQRKMMLNLLVIKSLKKKRSSKYYTLSDHVSIHDQQELQNYYDYVISSGEEGIMLKKANSTFTLGKGNSDFYKVKKLVEMDYVITGFEETNSSDYYERGFIGSVLGSIYIDGELKQVCKIGSMNDDWRYEFGTNGKAYINQVMTCVGYEVFKSGALRHPFFKGLHPDKTADMCVLESDTKGLFS